MLSGMSTLSGLHHAALTVADLDKSRAWYQDVLGLELAFDEAAEGRRACVLILPGSGQAIGLVEHGPGRRQPFDPTVVGLDHVAFTVGSREGLDDWASRLDAKGVSHSGAIDVPPGAILNFKDPDGIALALFWDRA
jgi:catechol 2,3-dioxygenase-like lactoylglutathione lyase family enzyme